MNTWRAVVLAIVWAVGPATGSVWAQDAASAPATRQEVLRQQREQKAQELRPYDPGALETWLVRLEQRRTVNRLFVPVSGPFPQIGGITPGASFSLGGGYRWLNAAGSGSEIEVSAAGSIKAYWEVEAGLRYPHLAGGRAFAGAYGRISEYPEEAFYGLGENSRPEDETSFLLRNVLFGVDGGWRFTPWLTLSGRIERHSPGVGRGRDSRVPAAETLFTDEQAPGLLFQPDFGLYGAALVADTRWPPGNPKRGGRYRAGYTFFEDIGFDLYGFKRLDLEAEHYFSFLKEKRVIALHALYSTIDRNADHQVPFWAQNWLGGSHSLRGFPSLRFRGPHLLLLQAEYRFEVLPALDVALFYDTGKVTMLRDDLDLKNLKHDYGIGFRFNTTAGVFLRADVAFGGGEGTQLVLSFSDVF